MTNRVINFYAGPAGLPLPALQRAQDELLDFAGTGMSVMEISHRSKEYDAVHEEALALVRELLSVPANHKILLMQGGAHLAFSMIPLNLLRATARSDQPLRATHHLREALGGDLELSGLRRVPPLEPVWRTQAALDGPPGPGDAAALPRLGPFERRVAP